MSILDDSEEWRENPDFKAAGPAWADYTGFYVGITICTVFVLGIIILNVVLGCCSPYKNYWRDPDTGNRYVLRIHISSETNIYFFKLTLMITNCDVNPG